MVDMVNSPLMSKALLVLEGGGARVPLDSHDINRHCQLLCLHPGAIVREQPNVALPHVSVARGCRQAGPFASK